MYKTALVWPQPDTYVYGSNPRYYNAYNTSLLKPVGCRALTMDGSRYSGGYTSGHTIKDIAFDLSSATDSTAGAYFNNVFTVHLTNVTFNNNPNSIPVAVLVQGTGGPSLDVSFDQVRIYGINGSPNTGTGLKLTSVAFKAYDIDIEGWNGTGGVGILTTGNWVFADFISPYMEGNTTNFSHQINYGQVNIFGGTLQPTSSSTNVITLGGSNFAAYGVGIQYVAGVVPINYTTTGLTNIEIRNSSSEYPGSAFVNAGADLSGSDIWPVPFGFVPSILSGFGTSPAISASSTDAFTIRIGIGGTANSGVLKMPTNTNGWACQFNDQSTLSTSVFMTRQTANTSTNVTLGNYDSAGSATAWNPGDTITAMCKRR